MRNAYDEVPYPSYPVAQSHPARLAAIATLFGMSPQAVQDCRVLELGCAGGGNLLPMAHALPHSRFVGVDLSGRQIAAGREQVERLGLRNIELLERSILDVAGEFGTFDYIICHGVWSWVPPEVQAKILRICREQLSPQGIAYISYNTYPGWHLRAPVREMMAYHARKHTAATERVGQARALLDFLVKAVPAENGAYGLLLKDEAETLARHPDWYLAHEHLEDCNQPMYFHEFNRLAIAEGLQYLGEAELGVMSSEGLPSSAATTIGRLAADRVEREQYMDFVRNRRFRQTLLCHAGLPLNDQANPARLAGLYLASPLKPPGSPFDSLDASEVKFAAAHGKMKISDPVLKTLIVVLAECWPQAIEFTRLARMVQERMQPQMQNAPRPCGKGAEFIGSLAASVLECCIKKGLELLSHPPRCELAASDRPLGSPVARLQCATQHVVANLLHGAVELNDVRRQVLRLADGTRDQNELAAALAEMSERGELKLHADGDDPEPVWSAAVWNDALRISLLQLARDGLLAA